MRIFFWEYSDNNDIQREWSMFILNLLALIFTTYTLIGTYYFHRKIVFQLAPLAINFFATLTLLILKLFQFNFKFDEVSYIIEIFTYLLLCYTFAYMYTKMSTSQINSSLLKICNIILILFGVAAFTMLILVFTDVIASECDNKLQLPAFISSISQVLCFIPIIYFASKILKHLSMNRKEMNARATNENIQRFFTSDQYIQQRRKQILVVLSALIFSVALRLTLYILTVQLKDLFQCKIIDNKTIVLSASIGGLIILIAIEVNQLIPHVFIPLALYVIPTLKKQKKSVQFNQSSLLENDDIQFDTDEINDNIQKRLSHAMSHINKD